MLKKNVRLIWYINIEWITTNTFYNIVLRFSRYKLTLSCFSLVISKLLTGSSIQTLMYSVLNTFQFRTEIVLLFTFMYDLAWQFQKNIELQFTSHRQFRFLWVFCVILNVRRRRRRRYVVRLTIYVGILFKISVWFLKIMISYLPWKAIAVYRFILLRVYKSAVTCI